MFKLDISRKAYGTHLIFNQTSFELSDHEMVAVKGKSGCGKSTLLAMVGLLEDFEGKYFFDDMEVTKKTREAIRKKNFAYVFQKPFLIPYLTVKENIMMPLKNLKEPNVVEKYQEMIDLLDLNDIENRYPEHLSGGEAQRVSIARAVLSNRKILLCDEPTGSLDPQNARIVMNCLSEILKKFQVSIVIVTHSNEFDSYFEKIYQIENEQVLLYENH